MSEFRKLLAANRGEIAIRVFRSAHELGIRTVAIYSHEDRFAMHRLKADEAYEVGRPGEPIRSYLNIEAIVELAKEKDGRRDPSRLRLPRRRTPSSPAPASAAGIVFVGPRPELLDLLGDKVAARKLAREAGVPVLVGERRSRSLPGDRGARAGRVARLSRDRQGVDGRRRPGHAGRRVGRRARRGARPGPPRGRRRRSACPTSSSRSSSAGPSTSRSSSSATGTATSSTSTSATARSSGGTRRSSRSPRPRTSTRRIRAGDLRRRASRIGRHVRYENAGTVEFLVDVETRASSTSSRSTRGSRSSTPSPRSSRASTWSRARS